MLSLGALALSFGEIMVLGGACGGAVTTGGVGTRGHGGCGEGLGRTGGEGLGNPPDLSSQKLPTSIECNEGWSGGGGIEGVVRWEGGNIRVI